MRSASVRAPANDPVTSPANTFVNAPIRHSAVLRAWLMHVARPYIDDCLLRVRLDGEESVLRAGFRCTHPMCRGAAKDPQRSPCHRCSHRRQRLRCPTRVARDLGAKPATQSRRRKDSSRKRGTNVKSHGYTRFGAPHSRTGALAELLGCGASAVASLHDRSTLARRARFCVADRAVGSQIASQRRARRVNVPRTSGRRSRAKSCTARGTDE